MKSIDEIILMLADNNSADVQKRGIELAQKIKNIGVFFKPYYLGIDSKILWKNCAEIIVSKTDEELEPYLTDMIKWFDEYNSPGVQLIFERLKKYKKSEILDYELKWHLKLNKILEKNNVVLLLENLIQVRKNNN